MYRWLLTNRDFWMSWWNPPKKCPNLSGSWSWSWNIIQFPKIENDYFPSAIVTQRAKVNSLECMYFLGNRKHAWILNAWIMNIDLYHCTKFGWITIPCPGPSSIATGGLWPSIFAAVCSYELYLRMCLAKTRDGCKQYLYLFLSRCPLFTEVKTTGHLYIQHVVDVFRYWHSAETGKSLSFLCHDKL